MCQKVFSFLPATFQIDILTANFQEQYISSDNGICMVFKRMP